MSLRQCEHLVQMQRLSAGYNRCCPLTDGQSWKQPQSLQQLPTATAWLTAAAAVHHSWPGSDCHKASTHLRTMMPSTVILLWGTGSSIFCTKSWHSGLSWMSAGMLYWWPTMRSSIQMKSVGVASTPSTATRATATTAQARGSQARQPQERLNFDIHFRQLCLDRWHLKVTKIKSSCVTYDAVQTSTDKQNMEWIGCWCTRSISSRLPPKTVGHITLQGCCGSSIASS